MSGYYDKIMHWGRRKGIVDWYKEKKIRIKEIFKVGKIGIRRNITREEKYGNFAIGEKYDKNNRKNCFSQNFPEKIF